MYFNKRTIAAFGLAVAQVFLASCSHKSPATRPSQAVAQTQVAGQGIRLETGGNVLSPEVVQAVLATVQIKGEGTLRGSGVVVKGDSDTYYIATTRSIASRLKDKKATIQTPEGYTIQGEVVAQAEGLDPRKRLDLAIIKVTTNRKLAVINIGSSTTLKKEESVNTIAYAVFEKSPFSDAEEEANRKKLLAQSKVSGTINGKELPQNPNIPLLVEYGKFLGNEKYESGASIHNSVDMGRGSNGGALVSQKSGELVGINSMDLDILYNQPGSAAIPVETVIKFFKENGITLDKQPQKSTLGIVRKPAQFFVLKA